MKSKRYEELTFSDDFMFCKILAQNEDICKELLELILHIRIRRVSVVNKQQEFSITADAKSIRLDVYVEDEDDTVFDVEMQTSKMKNLPKRTRYYQGVIDLNIIEKGAEYDDLKRSYIIFICMQDPFDEGLHLYNFENRCREKPELLLGDETVKVFVNAAGTADDISFEMAEFLRYLKEGVGESSLVKRIDAEVEKARSHEEWRTEYMALQLKYHDIWKDAWYDGRASGMEAGIAAGRREQLYELVRKNIITIEIAAKEADMTVEEFQKMMNEEE